MHLCAIFSCYQIASFASILSDKAKDAVWRHAPTGDGAAAAAFAAHAAYVASSDGASSSASASAAYAAGAARSNVALTGSNGDAIASVADAFAAHAAFVASSNSASSTASASAAGTARSHVALTGSNDDAIAIASTATASAVAALEEDVRSVRSVTPGLFQRFLGSSNENHSASDLRTRPLWPQGVPSEIEKPWQDFQADALSLNPRFKIWLDWYQDRLKGKPFNLDTEREWARFLGAQPIEFPPALQEPQEPSPAEDDTSPDIVPQEAGLQFAPQDDGRIALKPSGIAEADDLAEIAALLPPLIEVVDELISALQGSNAHASFVNVAERYKAVLEAEALSIDQLYAYGLRFENARHRLERAIKTGDLPDMPLPAGEAMDSVLALHGLVIASTKRGQEL